MTIENALRADTFRFVYSISHLNDEVRDLLEGSFPLIWVEGEISNFSAPSSGHWYLTLKDENAQVRAAMFRMRSMHVGFKPANGMKILARARVSLYTQRGDYQLILEHMEQAGDGALQRAFDALKARLSNEGLFNQDHKISLPLHPTCIGVVTSPTGAAIRDIISVLNRRFPAMKVILYPVAVQGTGAGKEIAAMIQRADARKECDVLIVGRGGGSLEDLWAFNEEVVARAIYACQLPVISAVGHEIDFTIADFVADIRAPTPSAAAELVSPDQDELCRKLLQQASRLSHLQRSRLSLWRQQLNWLSKRLQSPQQRLQNQGQRLDEMDLRLNKSIRQQLLQSRQRLDHTFARLERHNPSQYLQYLSERLNALRERQMLLMQHIQQTRQQRLALLVRAMDAISPLATLQRGYAIINRLPEHKVVMNSKDVQQGDLVEARLASGRLRCVVQEVIHE